MFIKHLPRPVGRDRNTPRVSDSQLTQLVAENPGQANHRPYRSPAALLDRKNPTGDVR